MKQKDSKSQILALFPTQAQTNPSDGDSNDHDDLDGEDEDNADGENRISEYGELSLLFYGIFYLYLTRIYSNRLLLF